MIFNADSHEFTINLVFHQNIFVFSLSNKILLHEMNLLNIKIHEICILVYHHMLALDSL